MASAFSVVRGAANTGSYSAAAGASNGPDSSHFTLTALSRWSILNKQLPPVDKIRVLHIYDFDNTLFKTPTPNPSLWLGQTIGSLANPDIFANGGWWHDNRILAATGEGVEKEEPRAWKGWWNEKIVELVRLSMKQPDALTVLLTGRSEQNFSQLIKRIVDSKGLEFDMIGLKPKVSPTNQRFQSTMHFKQLFINAMLETYVNAEDLRIYEDRPKHTKGFREFLAEYNRRQAIAPTRGPVAAEVIQVAELSTNLDPVVEVAEIQHMINHHNSLVANDPTKSALRIKKTVFFTSYMIKPEDSQKLMKLAQVPQGKRGHDLIYHGNNILICPRPCPPKIQEKVGGMGNKMLWEATGIACYQDRIWAVRMRPIPPEAKYHTENPVPLVVMALRRGARPIDAAKIEKWEGIPPHESFTIETTVGEKVVLRIESDDPKEDEYESQFPYKHSKRKHVSDDDWTPGNRQFPRQSTRGYHTRRAGRGHPTRGGNRGAGRGGRGRGGRAGYHNYRSLDDVEVDNQQGSHSQMDYDDAYPSLGQKPGRNRGGGNQGKYRGGGQNQGGQPPNAQDLQNYY
ncbi:hypothetical protein ACRE_083750 [Hapsidospora chrysogenum ATCC 11550]|uniref:Swiss Army Knife RNA repair protein HAD domain-containing protein n=1 Tax=Hapsidospora chrysogenum (strain ATCC 11550 / CBS 779.69 / DSM 880 / IAM 14645 / JCM 23072 / IMI 49137) TaxID=857340 RepID=A0A086SUY7_HAPC1|nr:hypothetical protein ACRE_083750 [Hapsidospora chrysogenum ATCC 11550]